MQISSFNPYYEQSKPNIIKLQMNINPFNSKNNSNNYQIKCSKSIVNII